MPGFSGESVGSITASLELNRDEFIRGLAAAREQVRQFEAERHQVDIKAALSGLEKVKADLKIAGKDVPVKPKLDEAALADLRARMKAVTERSYELKVKLAEATAEAQLKKLEAELKTATRNRDIRIKIDADTSSLTKLKDKLQQAAQGSDLLAKHGTMAKAAVGAIALGPQLLGSLGAGTAGAGALGVAGAGAGAAFGVLGLAVKSTLASQGNYYKNVQAVQSAQKQLTTAQNQGAVSTLAVQKAQQAVVTAQNRGVGSTKALTAAQVQGNAAASTAAQQHLAIVQASTASQLQGNQQLIAAAKQNLAVQKANLDDQNNLAQKVRNSWGQLTDAFKAAMGPAVQQVLGGMISMLGTLKSSIGLLTPGMTVLGKAVHDALSNPVIQQGVRDLIAGFGKMAAAAAPLVGPILKGIISLGKIFLNIATAAMPELVKVVGQLVGWLQKVAAHTANTAKFRAEIHHVVAEFMGWVQATINLGKALFPLFTSAAGFLPLLNVVIAITAAVVKLLASLGPLGRLLLGGMGVALLAGKFATLGKVIGFGVGIVGKFGTALKALALEGAAAKLIGVAGAFLNVNRLITLSASIMKAWDAVVAISEALMGPWGIAILAVAAIIGILIAFHRQIMAVVKAVWGAIVSVVKAAVDFLVKHLYLLFGVLGLIIHFHKQIEAAIKAAWEFIKKVVGEALKFIGSLIEKAWKRVEQMTTAAWHLVTKALSKAWDAIKKAVEDGVKAVVKVVTTLPGKALHALGDIAKTLFNAGVKLVEGFINGIVSMFEKVIEAAGNLVKSVGQTVLSVLGINSPSMVAHGWGQQVGEGLARGIEASQARVRGAVGALAGSVAHGFNVPAPAVGISGLPTPATDRARARAIAAEVELQLGRSGAGAAPSTVVHVHSSSLVPASGADLQKIAHTVTGALRRAGPAPAPRRVRAAS